MATKDAEAIAQGVYDAFLAVLTGSGIGNYPISHEYLIEAITEGVDRAFSRILNRAE